MYVLRVRHRLVHQGGAPQRHRRGNVNSGLRLQDRGCTGVTDEWRSVRNLISGKVYAVRPPSDGPSGFHASMFAPETRAGVVKTIPFYVKNSATPSSCISCRAREALMCDGKYALVGCGFSSPGYCSSCYMQSRDPAVDDQPCGNCQIGRLLVPKNNNGAVRGGRSRQSQSC